MRKLQIGDRKYIAISKFKIAYRTTREGEKCWLILGPLHIPYWRSAEDDNLFIPFFGKSIKIRRSRRERHYALRRRLTDDMICDLLQEELTPLLGYKPDLRNPKTFNEKINFMKLHDHNPLITMCCDKYSVKQYAATKIGEEYVLPVLKTWKHARDIDFDSLPDQFVLKVNWSSGYNIIVKDKSTLNIKQARQKLDYWMSPKQNSYYDTFNWGYKNMKPVIYAEPYIEQMDGQLYDYKLYCCHGKFRFMFIATDRLNKHGLTYTFYNAAGEMLPFRYGHKPNAVPAPKMPQHFDLMIHLAEKLAEPFRFVRVDFYETNDGRVYLGEMTFYSGGGTLCFDPIEWDRTLGDWME